MTLDALLSHAAQVYAAKRNYGCSAEMALFDAIRAGLDARGDVDASSREIAVAIRDHLAETHAAAVTEDAAEVQS